MLIIHAVNSASGPSSKFLLLAENSFEILWRHMSGSININIVAHVN
jgi:hypothetical protein